MSVPVSEVMRRAAELERARRRSVVRAVTPKLVIVPAPKPGPADRNPLFAGRCPLCGSRTAGSYCHEHSWAAG